MRLRAVPRFAGTAARAARPADGPRIDSAVGKNRKRAAHHGLPGDLPEDAAVTHAGPPGRAAPARTRRGRRRSRSVRFTYVTFADVPLRADPASPPPDEWIARSQREPADEPAAAGRDRSRPARVRRPRRRRARERTRRASRWERPEPSTSAPRAWPIGRSGRAPIPRAPSRPRSSPMGPARSSIRSGTDVQSALDVRRKPDVAVLRRLLPLSVRIEIRDAEDVLAREVVRHDAVTPALARVHPSIPRIGQRQREDVVFGLVDAVDVHRLARAQRSLPRRPPRRAPRRASRKRLVFPSASTLTR